jgi:hypothetical protein
MASEKFKSTTSTIKNNLLTLEPLATIIALEVEISVDPVLIDVGTPTNRTLTIGYVSHTHNVLASL